MRTKKPSAATTEGRFLTSQSSGASGGGRAQTVPVNVVDTTHEWLVVAPMPGLEPDDISIEASADRLLLRGRRRGPGQERHRYHQREWSYGPFERTVELPQAAAVDRANASYDNGILTLAVPKTPAAALKGGRVHITVDATGATRGTRVGHRGLAEAAGASASGAGDGVTPGERPER